MAAPVGHLTIKFNSIKFNSLGLLLYGFRSLQRLQHSMYANWTISQNANRQDFSSLSWPKVYSWNEVWMTLSGGGKKSQSLLSVMWRSQSPNLNSVLPRIKFDKSLFHVTHSACVARSVHKRTCWPAGWQAHDGHWFLSSFTVGGLRVFTSKKSMIQTAFVLSEWSLFNKFSLGRSGWS